MMRDARPVIYTAGPFRGDVKANVKAAEEFARKVWAAGAACISPHLNSVAFDGEFPDSVFLEGDLAIVAKCDAVIMMPGWKSSEGATKERLAALAWGIPVLYSLEELREWMAVRTQCA